MNGEKGLTIVELIVTVSVVAILALSLGFSYRGWIGAYKAESQMKNMYIDLMNARTKAMQKNRIYFVSLTTTQFTIYEDTYDATFTTNPDGDGVLQTASDVQFLQKPLDNRYPITWSNSGDPLPQVQFNKKGIANKNRVICTNADINTDYNCIDIRESTINSGKLTTQIPNGGACDATNCVAK